MKMYHWCFIPILSLSNWKMNLIKNIITQKKKKIQQLLVTGGTLGHVYCTAVVC